MFDFDAGKLLIIGVIALVVIGPKELPRVLRQVGQFVGKMRRMAAEFQGQFMDAMKEADIQSIREEIDKVTKETALDVNFDPARDIQAELTRTLDAAPASAAPTATLTEAAPLEPESTAVLPTDGYTLPQIEATASLAGEGELIEAEPESGTLAAAGLAPVVEEVASAPIHDEPAAAAASLPARKRKILLPKRRAPRIDVPHEVWNRTAARRSRALGPLRQGATQP